MPGRTRGPQEAFARPGSCSVCPEGRSVGEGRPARAGGRADRDSARSVRAAECPSAVAADTRHGTRTHATARGGLVGPFCCVRQAGQTPEDRRRVPSGRPLTGGAWVVPPVGRDSGMGVPSGRGEGREGEGRGVHVPWGRFRFCKMQEFRGWAVVTAAQPHAMGFVPPTIHLKMVQRVSFT